MEQAEGGYDGIGVGVGVGVGVGIGTDEIKRLVYAFCFEVGQKLRQMCA